MLSPSSAHRPDSTRKPRSAARAASSATSRVLPTPASPLISAWAGRPGAGIVEQAEQAGEFTVPADQPSR